MAKHRAEPVTEQVANALTGPVVQTAVLIAGTGAIPYFESTEAQAIPIQHVGTETGQTFTVSEDIITDPIIISGYSVSIKKPKPVPVPEPVPAPVVEAPAPVPAPAPSFPVGNGTFGWPVPAPINISDPFGPRVPPCAGCSAFHQGTDYWNAPGTPIYAIADGIVIESAGGGGLGEYIIIQHNVNGETFESVYAHMQYGSKRVVYGEVVTAGQQIGGMGMTGQATGNHLHLEVHVNGTAVDAHAFLLARI